MNVEREVKGIEDWGIDMVVQEYLFSNLLDLEAIAKRDNWSNEKFQNPGTVALTDISAPKKQDPDVLYETLELAVNKYSGNKHM